MIITCRGQRMGSDAMKELVMALSIQTETDTLRNLGYTLKPIRAPKRLDGGRLSLRLTWTKIEDGMRYVVRQTVTLEHPNVL